MVEGKKEHFKISSLMPPSGQMVFFLIEQHSNYFDSW